MKTTTIEWCDHTFNPWWGCTKVSTGCQHCYAESIARRFGGDIWGRNASRRHFGDQHWREPIRWHKSALRTGKRARVFCASMADVFEDHPDVEADRERLWHLIEGCSMLDWLLLTKRPEQMTAMAPWHIWPGNVWAMTSVETQSEADRRIPHLLQVPAKVRGLSVEPLLGPVDLTPWIDGLNWVIVGGESGPGARVMHPEWVRALRDQAAESGAAFFFKQWGGVKKKLAGRLLDGREWNEIPMARGGYLYE